MYFEIYKERKKSQFDIGEYETGGWRWRMRAKNGNILGDSGQSYSGGRSAIVKRVKKIISYIRDDSYIQIRDLDDGGKNLG